MTANAGILFINGFYLINSAVVLSKQDLKRQKQVVGYLVKVAN